MLTFEDLTTFVGTLSLLKAENDAASGRANTNRLTMLIIFLYLQIMILPLPVIEDACTIGGIRFGEEVAVHIFFCSLICTPQEVQLKSAARRCFVP